MLRKDGVVDRRATSRDSIHDHTFLDILPDDVHLRLTSLGTDRPITQGMRSPKYGDYEHGDESRMLPKECFREN